MTPDFSPDMLKGFLRARVQMMVRISYPSISRSAEKGARVQLQKESGLSKAEFWDAWQGHLTDSRLRAKIWAALWVDPADLGIHLLDDGTQERVHAP